MCDHTDAEKECEEKGEAEVDEFVKQDHKAIFLTNMNINSEPWWTHEDYPLNLQENPTPPPERGS